MYRKKVLEVQKYEEVEKGKKTGSSVPSVGEFGVL